MAMYVSSSLESSFSSPQTHFFRSPWYPQTTQLTYMACFITCTLQINRQSFFNFSEWLFKNLFTNNQIILRSASQKRTGEMRKTLDVSRRLFLLI